MSKRAEFSDDLSFSQEKTEEKPQKLELSVATHNINHGTKPETNKMKRLNNSVQFQLEQEIRFGSTFSGKGKQSVRRFSYKA